MKSESSLHEVNASVSVPEKRGFWKTLLAFIGPAYLVSVGYMDPGNWATDIAAGSQFGYKLIWVLLLSNVMALLLQTLAARLGIVKGWDLAQASRQQFPKPVNISLYVLAEIAIISCDLAEIIGMAIGLKLLFHIPLSWGVIITALDTFLLLFLLNKGIRKMEAFILALITVIGVSFIIEMFIIKPNLVAVSEGLVPTSLSDTALYIAIGIIGATVMPHNLYLHSALVQTRKFSRDDAGIKKAIKFNFIDSAIALNLALFVNAAILILAGSAFYVNGLHHITSIQDAHLLLSNLFGTLAPALFAIALIAAGQSSTITGTLAGQIIMEGYLNLRFSPWLRRLITRLLAIAPALFTIYYFGENRMGDLLVLSQVILSMQLGFAVIPLIHFTSNKKIMGTFVIPNWMKGFSWIVALIIVLLNALLVKDELTKLIHTVWSEHPIWVAIIVVFATAITLLLAYVTIAPFYRKNNAVKNPVPHGIETYLGKANITQYKHISLTLDFTQHDEATVSTALSLGGKHATYLLIHVVESAGAISFGKEIVDVETKHDLEVLRAYQHALKEKGYNVEVELGFGKSAKAIIQLVNERETDLLVMAAHGHRGIKDFIFGSTLDAVRHGVKVPVFIVK